MKKLIQKWQERQRHYEQLAEKHKDDEHNLKKFTYKAIATRDCWKELLSEGGKFNVRGLELKEGDKLCIHVISYGKKAGRSHNGVVVFHEGAYCIDYQDKTNRYITPLCNYTSACVFELKND